MPYTLEWNGDRLSSRVRRAAARGVLDVAVNAALAAKSIAREGNPNKPEYDDHPGTLKRSITVGAPRDAHESDFDRAKAGEDILAGREVDSLSYRDVSMNLPAMEDWGASTEIKVEVGSWVPYACVEEVRSPYLYPGIMVARATSLDDMIRSFREEFA